MTRRYPIVRHRELWPSLPWRALRRRPPVAGADQILVYRTGRDAYTAGLSDTTLAARASAVSVVDLSRDVGLVLAWSLAARDSALDFPVRVTYRCTVVDPVAVVRARGTEAVSDTRRFLARDGRPSALDRACAPGDERDLHEALTTLVTARLARGSVPGVRVLADVEVGPADLHATEA
ncbi:hypothetical protein AQJ84_35110 [Streptomyces resistomycificus]|uniref:Uncharacterized protein n=2 Tax=Streptomyces resistomycificus TaxID=67356 RepID=A0A0L8KY64_9ACTN|nr:hypothetical protein ADK37_32815 [Streptomyces resistomycificus]KUN91732.1 hypothetical protein AQJ84_35110 [Streptomyces resistomycificus]